MHSECNTNCTLKQHQWNVSLKPVIVCKYINLYPYNSSTMILVVIIKLFEIMILYAFWLKSKNWCTRLYVCYIKKTETSVKKYLSAQNYKRHSLALWFPWRPRNTEMIAIFSKKWTCLHMHYYKPKF